ncbi:hypothetical protein OROMI_010137 [Orobanche minor]
MSSRRSRSGQPRTSSRITADQIAHLVSNLQQQIAEFRSMPTPSNQASVQAVLQDACNYIKTLQGEVGDLSRRLCRLMQFTEDSDEAAFIRSLLNNGRS